MLEQEKLAIMKNVVLVAKELEVLEEMRIPIHLLEKKVLLILSQKPE
jgi:hypothetical protein